MGNAIKIQSTDSIRDRYLELRNMLIHRRAELLRHTDEERAGLSQQVIDTPGDAADASVVDSNADYFLQLADNDRRELLEIQDALSRMQKGVYGICESCDTEIAIERLKRVPQARYCIDCASLAESRWRTARPQSAPKL